jgi:hypothetical protein
VWIGQPAVCLSHRWRAAREAVCIQPNDLLRARPPYNSQARSRVIPNGGFLFVGANSFAWRIIPKPYSRCDEHYGIHPVGHIQSLPDSSVPGE